MTSPSSAGAGEARLENEHCVHCVLSPHLQQFLVEHQDKSPGQVGGELMQMMAEYLALVSPIAGMMQRNIECVIELLRALGQETWDDYHARRPS
jgi:hypothetical protein